MLTKIIWEMFSVALLLYGLYLVYAFIWFSVYRIYDINPGTAKVFAGLVTIGILIYSSFKWFKKKHREIKRMQAGT